MSRKYEYSIRAIGLLVVGYAAAIFSLRLDGLLGAGPLYLFVIPVVALIFALKRLPAITIGSFSAAFTKASNILDGPG